MYVKILYCKYNYIDNYNKKNIKKGYEMMYDGINIFSDDIRVYEYALNQIPDRENAIEPSYARNDTFDHALRVVENLFKRAQKEIYIKSSLFCKKFYLDDRIINALNELKNKNKNIKVNVLIEQENSEETIGQEEVIKKFKEIFGEDNVKVKYLNKNKQLKVNDFILIDEHDFRYELEEPKLFDACKDDVILNTRASACFNAHKNVPNRAIKLKEVFKYLSA